MKIANDLRLMNSGPFGGFAEIRLAQMQRGSTIMPGKVNPVIAEMTIQVAIKVLSNDFAVTTAAALGEFELNAFTPLIAEALLDSLSLLNHAVPIFMTKCIETIEADRDRCRDILDASYAFATAYAAKLGYDQVARIIEEENGDAASIKKRLERQSSLSSDI
jgi:aspartate ammonia-lyase